MTLTLKSFVLLVAGITVLILALVVLIGSPSNPAHLLAWAGVATGIAFVTWTWPER